MIQFLSYASNNYRWEIHNANRFFNNEGFFRWGACTNVLFSLFRICELQLASDNKSYFFEKDVLSLAIIESKILHMASFSSSGCGQKSSRSKVYWMTKTLLVKALTCENLLARVIRPRVTSVRVLESGFIKVNPLRSGLSVRNWIICWSKGCDRNK